MKKFQSEFLGVGKITPINEEFNTRLYMTHVLSEGSIIEKKELLSCIKNKIVMKKKKLYIEKH